MSLTNIEKDVLKEWLRNVRTNKVKDYKVSLDILEKMLKSKGIDRMVTQVAFDFLNDIGGVKAQSDDLTYFLTVLPENKKPSEVVIKKYIPPKDWPKFLHSSLDREESDNGLLKFYVGLTLGDISSIIPNLKSNMYEDDRAEFDTLNEQDQSDIMNDLIQDYFHSSKIETRLDDECWDYISEKFNAGEELYTSSLKIDEYPKFKNLKNAVLKIEIEVTVRPPKINIGELETKLKEKFKSLI